MEINKIDNETIETIEPHIHTIKKEQLEEERKNFLDNIDRLNERINQIDNLLSYFK